MRLIDLPPNRPRQFYRGGSMLAEFRGVAATDDHRPEDWIASTTARHGAEHGEGLTTLPDGRLLRDALLEDPEGWLGAEHAAALGADPALLVKLLDAGERLPVHAHPTRPLPGSTSAAAAARPKPGSSLPCAATRPASTSALRATSRLPSSIAGRRRRTRARCSPACTAGGRAG